MRKNLNPLKIRLGSKRLVTKFLWFPKIINEELRWLETSTIIQQVINVDVGGSDEWGKHKAMWVDTGWHQFTPGFKDTKAK